MTFNVNLTCYNSETNKHDSVMETRGTGTTIHTWMASVQVMSDVWETARHVTYWDEVQQCPRTEVWVNNVCVDATDEVLQKVYQFFYNNAIESLTELAQLEAMRIRKDSVVEVTSGRNGKGTRGKVVVEIERPYGMGWRTSMEKKVAIATSDVTIKVPARNGKVYENYRDVVWVWARNCSLVEVPEIDLESVKEQAKNQTNRVMARYVTL